MCNFIPYVTILHSKMFRCAFKHMHNGTFTSKKREPANYAYYGAGKLMERISFQTHQLSLKRTKFKFCKVFSPVLPFALCFAL